MCVGGFGCACVHACVCMCVCVCVHVSIKNRCHALAVRRMRWW